MNWEVRITGDDADLRMLEEAFKEPERTIIGRGAEFFLRSTVFEPLSDAGIVRDKAREIIASLSAASMLLLGSSRSIEVNHVVQLEDDGRRHVNVFLEPIAIHVRALPGGVVVAHADGTVENHLAADPVVEAMRKAVQSEVVQRVLRLRDAPELWWADLYRIFEIIKGNGGTDSANKTEVKRFKRTANSVGAAGDLARHGTEQSQPPPNPMTLREGRDFIDQMIRAWLSSK